MDSSVSVAISPHRICSIWPSNRSISEIVCSVSFGRPSLYRSLICSSVRSLSNAFPMAVAFAGSFVPTQDIIRMAWGESFFATYKTLPPSKIPNWLVSCVDSVTLFIMLINGSNPLCDVHEAPIIYVRNPNLYFPLPASHIIYFLCSNVCTIGKRLLLGAFKATASSVSVSPSWTSESDSTISNTRAVALCCSCPINNPFKKIFHKIYCKN